MREKEDTPARGSGEIANSKLNARSGTPSELLKFSKEFVPLATGLVDLPRFRDDVPLAANRRVLQMLRPAAQLARDALGQCFQF